MTVKLQIPEPAEILVTEDPVKVRPLMQSEKAKIADSEKRSIEYGTITTVSDLDSEVRFSVFLLDIPQIQIQFIIFEKSIQNVFTST